TPPRRRCCTRADRIFPEISIANGVGPGSDDAIPRSSWIPGARQRRGTRGTEVMMSATIIRPVQQILVATDFSDSADAALGVAIQYARGFRARVHLVHVFAAREVDVTQLL